MRIRFRFLQTLNSSLESQLLPLIDLKVCDVYRHSTAAMLSDIRRLVFYSSKLKLFNVVLNYTALRRSEQAAPEVILNPLEVIGCKWFSVILTTGARKAEIILIVYSFRRIEGRSEDSVLPSNTATASGAFQSAVRQTCEWQRPYVRLQYTLHRRKGSRHQ